MNIKLAITYTLTALSLTACQQLPPNSYVEQRDLLRSMVYTQRHLIELELGNQAKNETSQRELLLLSHCDLIDRDFVQTKNTPVPCQTLHSRKSQLCIATFHRCIGQCPTPRQDCKRCEQQAVQCLASQPQNQSQDQ